MAVAALVVSIVSALAALGALIGLRYSRQSANAAQGSQVAADSAAVSAVTAAAAAQAQAEAARRQMENDRARLHREMTPELEGSVRGRQFGRGVVSYQLEVRAKMSQPLSSLRLTLPAGGPIAQRRGAMEMRHDLFYPEPGGRGGTLRPGSPATWTVELTGIAASSFVASADCRSERGELWEGVEVPISLEGS